ncbi:MAG: hypothetical protein WCD43_01455 [Candidatus Acidiferrales bacterium]
MKKKKKTRSTPIKSRILRQIASEVKAGKKDLLAGVGHSKGDHLSSAFVKE